MGWICRGGRVGVSADGRILVRVSVCIVGMGRRRRTAHSGGRAFNCEEHGEDGVGDAVVDYVAFPGDFDAAAGCDEDVYAVHYCELDASTADFFVCVFFHGVTVDFFAFHCFVGDACLFDGAECAFERPPDQLSACSGQCEVLAADNRGRREASILFEVFGSHE